MGENSNEVEIGSKMSRGAKCGIVASVVIAVGLIVGLSVGFCGMDSYCGSTSDDVTTTPLPTTEMTTIVIPTTTTTSTTQGYKSIGFSILILILQFL